MNGRAVLTKALEYSSQVLLRCEGVDDRRSEIAASIETIGEFTRSAALASAGGSIDGHDHYGSVVERFQKMSN